MQHFSALQVSVGDADVDTLKVIPCYASPGLLLKSEMVLVKPNSVITCDVSDFHPFLHKLPDDFKLVTPLMESIELDLTHIQIVLDSAYRCANGKELDVNTFVNECVKKAITLKYIDYKIMRIRAKVWMKILINNYHHCTFRAQVKHLQHVLSTKLV